MDARFEQLHCPMNYTVYKFQPEIGEFSACCDARPIQFNAEEFDRLGDDYFTKLPALIERKQALYDNIKHSDCQQCWKKEDRGITSMRLHHGPSYTSIFGNRSIPTDEAYPERIEFWMNSTCNLGCFMCWVGNSNTLRKIWYKDRDTNDSDGAGYDAWLSQSDYYKGEYVQRFTDSMIKFAIKSIKDATYGMNIAYLGGEPTLHNEMYTHADLFIEAGREGIAKGKQFTIEITTNGTSKDKLNERFYEMFEKYKAAGWNTKIMLSQDGAHDQVMVRHGADFDQIKRNFGTWMSKDSCVNHVRSFTVVSGLNLPYIHEMAEYIDGVIRNNLVEGKPFTGDIKFVEIAFNALEDPKWMQTSYLPSKYAKENIQKANAIFEKLAKDFRNVVYEKDYFFSVTGQLADTLTTDQVEFFFNKIDYVNSIYQKTYPTWDFYTTFPHLDMMRTEYGLK